ncbi:unnamed protein product [Prunus armeniaca]
MQTNNTTRKQEVKASDYLEIMLDRLACSRSAKVFMWFTAISPSALPQIFKNALTVPIPLDIINEEMDLAVNYLDNLTRVPRFDTLIMFLSSSDNDAMHASIWDEVLDNEATPIEYAEKLDNLHTKYCPKR